MREASERAGKAATDLTARRELVLDHLKDMRERLVAAAGQIEEVIRSRGEDLPPLDLDVAPPARITVPGAPPPPPAPNAPATVAVETAEA
ncbi:MAG: hypothetical protein ACKO8G_03920, partial [Actinomycetota bacterium]